MAYRLDERDVRPAYLIQSVPDDGSVRPQLRTCRYPMPGDEHLPLYEPILFDVVTRRQWRLPHVSTWRSVLSYYLSWSADGRDVYSLNLDRFSRTLTLTRANALTGDVRELLTEKSVTRVHANAGSAIDLPVVRVLGSGDILWYSQRDGWGHLYYYDAPGTLRAQITRGNWNVRSIAYVDEARHLVYFTASGREDGRDPYEEHLYRSRFDGTGMQLLTPEDADHDFHHTSPSVSDDASLKDPERASFSPSGRYFVDTYSRPDLPSVLTLRRADGGLVKQLEQADISKLQKDGYTPVEPFRTVAADGITAIYGNLFRPSTFDATKKYPVIDAVYPGPQIVRVRKDFTAAHFDIFEAQSLAELGFIVVTVDGRGTPNRSKAFADHSYGRLDRASDPEDHIAAIRELAHRYPYMDVSRVGIDGASGGGYAAARGVLAYPDFYKVAVAAEGNHDWRGYLAGWAETFIGPLGERDYSVTSNLPLAANLKGKLLLAHGEMDDNVLPMQALKLADALVKANRDFDLLIVPNERHDMFITSPYFIRRKWDYFVRNLLGAEPPAGYRIERSQ
jgi:dipeptidyl aminopeptidase/acylaminoacyl peptidase